MRIIDKAIVWIDITLRTIMRLLGLFNPNRMANTFFGAIIKCDIRDFIQRRIYFFGMYEPNLSFFLKNRIKSGDCFVDLGANIGYFSLLASILVGEKGQVISIEAAPETFRLLSENLNLNHCSNVVALNIAATKNETTVEIVENDPKNIGKNSIKIINGNENASKIHGEPILSIIGANISHVNFIKIDIEGSEEPILDDLIANITRLPEELIIIAEINPTSAHYIQQFQKLGFASYALPNNYLIPYYLTRYYLRKYEEGSFDTIIPVRVYENKYTDYVFVRSKCLSD